MAWKKKVSHQITRGYLSRRYSIPNQVLLADPPISDLPFYNAEISEEMRRNEMRIVAGRLLRFCVDMNLDREDGSDLDVTFNDLVQLLTEGKKQSSEIGELIDACFKCIDEE
jgi:hypothetical protein